MKIGRAYARSVPTDGASAELPPPPPRRGRRAAGLIVAALLLMAAFIAVAPYLASAIRQGYSIFSGLNTNGSGTTIVNTSSFSTSTNCSSVVSVRSLVAPDITGGSAAIAYPPDYCTLAAFALSQVNADRAANGTGPVSLGYNQAAQQHADSMLYYGYFSHYDTQGYKPYMRYTLLGGRGADYENVAYFYNSGQPYTSTNAVEQAIKALEHSMVYDDVTCCNNGHKYNILNPLHNIVSIGVAYNGTTVYFDEEFENDYINLSFNATGASASNPYYVTMQGTPIQGVPTPNSIYIAFDGAPSAESRTQLNNGPNEYGPGKLVGGVLPQGVFGSCGQFTTGTTVCADTWTFNSKTVDIAFSLHDFIKNNGPGVYTVYLITGSSTDSSLTTISVFVP
ncbi:MAG: CAP domain-containing protein [Thaumarchaeota archaeon]|nr:CAP domain-containing protein [Nitrososphaerota archaeon]